MITHLPKDLAVPLRPIGVFPLTSSEPVLIPLVVNQSLIIVRAPPSAEDFAAGMECLAPIADPRHYLTGSHATGTAPSLGLEPTYPLQGDRVMPSLCRSKTRTWLAGARFPGPYRLLDRLRKAALY